jgi:membrane associated rhomboid family serine protease
MQNIVYVIIAITVAISYFSWQKPDLFQKLLLDPYRVVHNNEYYRIVSHGFIHANWSHLLVNMLVFWSFGSVVIQYFELIWGIYAIGLLILLYISAIVISSLYSVAKHKDDYSYSAVGASGATSAIIFASMFFDPWNMIYFFGVLPIPGILFGFLYLIYSFRMAKIGNDNIGHDAHFWGAVYGFVFPMMFKPELYKYFLDKLVSLW